MIYYIALTWIWTRPGKRKLSECRLTVDVAVHLDGSDKFLELLDTDLQMIILGNVASVETLLTQRASRAFLAQNISYAQFAE